MPKQLIWRNIKPPPPEWMFFFLQQTSLYSYYRNQEGLFITTPRVANEVSGIVLEVPR